MVWKNGGKMEEKWRKNGGKMKEKHIKSNKKQQSLRSNRLAVLRAYETEWPF